MAFKNLLTANQASADFLGTTSGVAGGFGGGTVTVSTDWAAQGKKSFKVNTPGSVKYEGLRSNIIAPVSASTIYTFKCILHGIEGQTFTVALYDQSWSGVGVSIGIITGTVENGLCSLVLNATTKSTQTGMHFGVYTNSILATNFYLDKLQLEPGPVSTPWEFPGIDLTGNTIPSSESVNNLTLESLLKLDSIQPTSQIQDLIIQNTLQLLGIPSTEQVNDIQLLNQIILDAVESTGTVNDLIIYVLREMAIYNVTINRKEEYNTILNRKEEYEVKV